MKLLVVSILVLCSISCVAQRLNASYSELFADSSIYYQLVNKYINSEDNIETIITNVASDFIGTPYVANTLDTSSSENLISNLSEVDCTTFVEYVLAISRTIKHNEFSYNSFLSELKLIRYRDGLISGYSSRLHYFSDWLYNNEQKNIIYSLDSSFQKAFDKQINFMSTNSESYSVLKNSSFLLPEIEKCEKYINTRNYFYIPKNNIINMEDKLRDGDIIGITTSIKGLDISHVGFIIIKNGHAHLLHASSTSKKVVISNKTLYNYLLNIKSATGIMVGRPL